MDQFSESNPAGPLPDLSGQAQVVDHEIAVDIDVPFTPAARRVLDRCVDSLADGDDGALTGCLLRAISETPESAAAQLIDERGESGEMLLNALQEMLCRDDEGTGHESSPRLERVVIRAKREAFRHRHVEVSTLHLLMALLRERTASSMNVVH